MLAAGRTGCGLAGLAFFVLAAATITTRT